MTPRTRARVLREWQPFAGGETPWNQPAAPGLDTVVPGVMQKLGLAQRLQQSQVFVHWPQIVGPDIARHAQPVSLRHGLLTVAVDHPVWLQELSRFHKALLLDKVRDRVGQKTIRDIVFRIG
jgi:predicted nucleic acid-binding Zn ribbon protein